MVTVAVFGMFVWAYPSEVLTAEKIFVSVALFNMIRIPLTLLPWALMDAIKLIVSINRIQAFLNAEELNDECVGTNLQNEEINSLKLAATIRCEIKKS